MNHTKTEPRILKMSAGEIADLAGGTDIETDRGVARGDAKAFLLPNAGLARGRTSIFAPQNPWHTLGLLIVKTPCHFQKNAKLSKKAAIAQLVVASVL